jgi:hypothetical protein
VQRPRTALTVASGDGAANGETSFRMIAAAVRSNARITAMSKQKYAFAINRNRS